MAGRLKGKIAVVTAAGQGIGRAIAEAFVREGATVWATDRDTDKLEGLARVKRRKLDVLSDRAVNAFAEKVGTIDILVNAAGFVHHGTVLDCGDKDWDFSFDLNVKSMHRTIKAFLPGMLAKGHGSIVNIASSAAHLGVDNGVIYSVAKAGVVQYSRSLATQLRENGIRVNAVSPGPTRTARFAATRVMDASDLDDSAPLARYGKPDDIADVVAFLLSDESRYISGQTIRVDGARETFST